MTVRDDSGLNLAAINVGSTPQTRDASFVLTPNSARKRFWRRSQNAPWAGIFFDPGITGGAGTYASPYGNDMIEEYLLGLEDAGDLHGRRFKFKAGTTFRGQFVLSGCSNYIVEPYGDGAAPIISNHVVVADAINFTADDTGGGNAHADVCFCSTSTGTPWSYGNVSPVLVVSGVPYQCEPVASRAELIASLYTSVVSGYESGYPFRYWWDTGASRIWIRRPSDHSLVTMNTSGGLLIGATALGAGEIAMTLIDGEDVTVSDIVLQIGGRSNFLASQISGLTLNRVVSRCSGGIAAGTGNCFDVRGTDTSTRATDLTMNACQALRSRGGLGSHGLEMSWVDNAAIDDFIVNDIGNHGIEFWESCSDILVRRMKCRQTQSLAILRQGDAGAATHHERVTIINSECVQRVSATKTGSSMEAGGAGIILADATKITTDLKILNNSFDLDCNRAIYAEAMVTNTGSGSNNVKFKNNLCRFSQITTAASQYAGVASPGTETLADMWSMNANIYQFGNAATNCLRWAAGVNSTQAAWRAAASPNETTSQVLASTAQLLNGGGGTLVTTDLTLLNQVVANIADMVDADTPTTDILGLTRSDDVGAYEYIPGSDSTPTAFTFTDIINQTPGAVVTHAAFTVAGINTGAAISISGASGQYSINGGAFTSSAGTVYNGQSVVVRHTVGSAGVTTGCTLTIGGISDTFSSTALNVITGSIVDSTFDVGYEQSGAWNDGEVIVADDDGSNTVNAGDAVGGFYFTLSGTASSCSAATISLTVLDDWFPADGSGRFLVRAETQSNGVAVTKWAQGHRPIAATMVTGNSAEATENAGGKTIDITTIVQNVIAARGEGITRLNLRVQASITSTAVNISPSATLSITG